MKYEIILICSFGAFTQEFIHWYELRGKLHLNKYKTMIKSPLYWIITICMILISGIGCYLLFETKIYNYKDLQFILGAAFPLIFKKMVSSISNNYETKLGDEKNYNQVLKDYFN